jgi:putative ABC transport system permease protein
VTAADSELGALAAQLERQFPDHNTKVGMAALPLQDTMVQSIRPALTILLGAVGLVLLIACVNVANLLLARAAGRSTEFAVRTALGAGRVRLVRQLFTESVILAALGGLAGLLLSAWLTDLLIAARPEGVPRLDEIETNQYVVAFTAAVSVFTALLFGLMPAVQVTRGNLARSINEAGRSGDTSAGGARLRRALVAAEIALALMLLVGAGLLVRSFHKLTSVDPGFAATDGLTFRFAIPESGYEQDRQAALLLERTIEAIRTVAGVTDAGATVGLPLTGVSFNLSFNVRGRPPRKPGDEEALEVRVVTPEYFRAIGLPLRKGRVFTAQDRTGAEKVAIISESAARKHFAGEEPIDKYIELGWRRSEGQERVGGRVVGVVADAKEHGLDEDFPPEIYIPHPQAPLHSMQFVIRTSVPPMSVTAPIAARLRELEPRAPVYRVMTLRELVGASVAEPKFYMMLLAGFAVVALILATIGIFGVMSYSVAQRTREIGIRMALGAEAGDVVGLVLRQTATLVVVGIAAGVAMALALSRAMQKLLFELSPTDPATITGVALLLALVAVLAGYVPARRATRVDPLTALRTE